MVETEAPEAEPFDEYVRRMLQQMLNDYPGDSGSTLIGDYMLVIEGHTAEGTILRIIDNDLTFWRRLGLVDFVSQQVTAEMAGNVAWGAAQTFQDGGFDDDDDSAGTTGV